jgi:hypothetical protein
MANQFITDALTAKLELEINVFVVLNCAEGAMLTIYWKCTLSKRNKNLSESGVVMGTTILPIY